MIFLKELRFFSIITVCIPDICQKKLYTSKQCNSVGVKKRWGENQTIYFHICGYDRKKTAFANEVLILFDKNN